ncbi:MAG: hypothetical protein ACOC29_00420 [Candidatus Sumerlaeota bacterium]
MKFIVFIVLLLVCVVTFVQISRPSDPAAELEKAQTTPRGATRIFSEGAILDDMERMKMVSKGRSANFEESFLNTLHYMENEVDMQAGKFSTMGMGAGGESLKVFFYTEEDDLLGSFTYILKEDESGKWWVIQASMD